MSSIIRCRRHPINQRARIRVFSNATTILSEESDRGIAALPRMRLSKARLLKVLQDLDAVPSIGAERPQWIGAGGAISRTETGTDGSDSHGGDGCHQHGRVRRVHVKQ